jgi:hypothetical protein
MATTTSDLNRLYSMLTEKTGIERYRDVRLEKIAAERALEMRYQQGLLFDSDNPIQHEPYQLRARVYPWQDTDGVTENALWHYYPPTWVDHIQAAVDFTFPDDPETYGSSAGLSIGWWNSNIHRDQLLDTRWTSWGNGIYYEDTNLGARRWYFITVFASDLDDLNTKEITLTPALYFAYHLTADGKTIHKARKAFSADTSVLVDDRAHIPGRGPMFHLASTSLRHRWIADDERIKW